MSVSEKNLAQAYLLGAYLGDGHCQWQHTSGDPSYTFFLPSMDTDLLDKVRDCIHLCFPNLQGRVSITQYEGKNYEWLRCHSKDLCTFLRGRCLVKERLPSYSDGQLLREFIAGLMDTDGWITQAKPTVKVPGPRWQMGFATTSPWYGDLRRKFQQSGVVLGKVGKVWKPPHKEGLWADCYNMYINIASFIDAGFYFSIQRKQKRLEDWQRHIRGELPTTTRLAPTQTS